MLPAPETPPVSDYLITFKKGYDGASQIRLSGVAQVYNNQLMQQIFVDKYDRIIFQAYAPDVLYFINVSNIKE